MEEENPSTAAQQTAAQNSTPTVSPSFLFFLMSTAIRMKRLKRKTKQSAITASSSGR